jgi:hypothetical protein
MPRPSRRIVNIDLRRPCGETTRRFLALSGSPGLLRARRGRKSSRPATERTCDPSRMAYGGGYTSRCGRQPAGTGARRGVRRCRCSALLRARGARTSCAGRLPAACEAARCQLPGAGFGAARRRRRGSPARARRSRAGLKTRDSLRASPPPRPGLNARAAPSDQLQINIEGFNYDSQLADLRQDVKKIKQVGRRGRGAPRTAARLPDGAARRAHAAPPRRAPSPPAAGLCH